jgi:hypothetical protein
MKQFTFFVLLVGFALLPAIPANASPVIYANFCPGNASCPGGITEASLSFSLDTATQDANDYFLTVTISGDNTAPAYLDMFSFTIADVDTPLGYASSPTLLNAPGGTSLYTTVFDNVSNSATACTTNTGQSQEVCTNTLSALGFALPGQTATFQFYVDLSGNYLIAPDNGLNLRAAFNNADGSNAGILSPDGNYATMAPVPEPTSMLLFGSGIFGVAAKVRNKRKLRQ